MTEQAGGRAQLTVRAPAKVNLSLEVLGTRPDGFHDIRTVMQAVSVCDEMRFRSRDDGQVRLTCSEPGLPTDDRNLVLRAALTLQERLGVRVGVDVDLVKRIPVGGGLGGGSSDCAVTMLALRKLWGLDVDVHRLADIGGELGSDVPFFFWGGTARCEGRGERIEPIECARTFHYVLVTPPCPVSTAAVYAVAGSGLTTGSHASENVGRAVKEGNVGLLGASLQNGLQDATLSLHPELRKLWRKLEDLRAGCNARGMLLSGSGSSVLMLCDGAGEAQRAARFLSSELQVPCAAAHSLPAWRDRFSLLRVRRGHL